MPATPSTELTVLVADDDPVSRLSFQRTVERAAGLQLVAVCEDGDEALEAVREHRPDVAVLDQFMPGHDGVEVAARIKRDGLGTLCVLVSASLDRVDATEVRRAGVVAWYEKSQVSALRLGDALRAVAARHRGRVRR